AVSPAVSFSCTDADDALTAVILAAGLGRIARGRNDDAAPRGFLSPATERGAATADRDAVAIACVRGCVVAASPWLAVRC
ncbi:hypothetical protein Q8G39_28745, partial [Klebsiella pneumoniae]|uniref:hypothetical protein n=1 Tax=Klebsiella pneumoniae TaxID=573 RepID=UPI003013B2DC